MSKSDKRKPYGKPLKDHPHIRPVLKNDNTAEPTGQYVIVRGRKELRKGTLAELLS